MLFRICVNALLWLVFPFVHAASEPSMVWDVEYLAGDYQNPMVYSEEIILRDQRERAVKRVTSTQIEAMLEVMQHINGAAELNVRLYVVEGDAPNAYASGDDEEAGVFVNFGMMDLIQVDSDQWAALLGHEVAHIKLGHGDKNEKRRIPINIFSAAVGGLAKTPLAAQATQLLTTGVASKFSRDQERQSDYLGAIWAVEAGYDPYGAAALHEELSRQSLRLNIPFILSHPSDKERIVNLNKLAKRLDKNSR
ncbi:MAG TPA: hypothetical protein DCM54_15420 [Gammaproteobacteria bacterium]|nr:hypothetical protein [Gammaproteobacteria bacterium]|tara:strand:+ start:291 stop:1043 length:753 start_codon:yes stop_codon:yes gene_type:complete